MKQTLKKSLSIVALISAAFANADSQVAPYLSFRSQSMDAARELVGWTNEVNLYDMEKIYGSFAITPEYTKSFRPHKLAECLFGSDLVKNTSSSSDSCSSSCDDERCINISGSRAAAARGAGDWLADYFGLATDFDGQICFEPRVSNFLVDLNLYVGLDEWYNGLYFRVHAPITHAKYDLNFKEKTATAEGALGYDEGYMSEAAVTHANVVQNATAFFDGSSAPNLGNTVTFKKLCAAKMRCKSDSETGLADLRMALGWNFLSEEDYHMGLNFRVAAPTGNAPKGEYVFEAIVGNGNHWEVGVGLSSHVILWRSETEDKHFGFYMDANVMHLFETKQRRTFDLKGLPNSRYMLAEKLGTPVTDLFANAVAGDQAGSEAPSAQFKNELAPVANFSTQDVDVSVGAAGDVVAMFNYTSGGFAWDLGYNFWGRSCEKIKCRSNDNCDTDCNTDCITFAENTWALKGDAHVYGFNETGNAPIALSATQGGATAASQANIHGGKNFSVTNPNDAASILVAVQNPNIDNAQFARVIAANNVGNNIETTSAGGTQTRTSKDSVFIAATDFDYDGAETRGISHKVFTHLSYAWVDKEDWVPYLGVGAMAEFGSNPSSVCDNEASSSSCDTSCDSCQKCSLSQWGVWVKGGVSFN